jgi:Second Messenger Oligonucleotide or Dinucleotide Synthetase domain
MALLTGASPFPTPLSAAAPASRWAYVRSRFERFLENLRITADQAEDGEKKRESVVGLLNRTYWDNPSATANHVLIGSWGKATRVRPPRDIDLLFLPPVDLLYEFDRRAGNKQSQLLQDVAEALRNSYPQTVIRGDGQVVLVGFNTYQIEVAPAFHCKEGGFLICDTNNGGRWKHVDPEGEIAALDAADRQHNGNVRKLTRIMKQWQRYCDVPIKSFQLEALVKEMLPTKSYGGEDEFWFDWLARDFLAHMIGRANGGFRMPGCAQEWIPLGNAWLSKTRTAYDRALKACTYEDDNYDLLAGIEWQTIFGTMIPATAG